MTAAILAQILLLGAGVGVIALIALLARPLARHDPVLRYRLVLASLAAAVALPAAQLGSAVFIRTEPTQILVPITLDGCHQHPADAAFASLLPPPPPAAPTADQPPGAKTRSLPPEPLLAVYAAGVLTVVAITAIRIRRAARIVRQARPLTDPAAAALAATLAAELRIRRPVALLESAEVAAPACWSLRRCAILLPPGAADTLGPAALRCVLHHELIHIRRRDSLIGLAHALVAALAWFQPLIWVLGRALARDAEASCDALVVRATRSPSTYAHALLAACRSAIHAPAPFAAFGSARRIRRRIAMLNVAQHPAGRARTISLGASALAALGAVLATGVAAGAGLAPAGDALTRRPSRIEIHAPPGVRDWRRVATNRAWWDLTPTPPGSPAAAQPDPWVRPAAPTPDGALAESETVLSAKNAEVRGTTITAAAFTLSLPSGSMLRAACEAERTDLAPDAAGTRIVLHAGEVRITDHGGVERLSIRPSRPADQLILIGAARDGEFRWNVTAINDRGHTAAIEATYDAKAGVPEGEKAPPPGSVRWNFSPESATEPLQLKMRWSYLEGC